MKKSFIIAGLGALLVTSAFSTAQAEERWPRWYLGLSGSYTYMDDVDVSGGSVNRLSMDSGYGIGASIGFLPTSSSPLLNSLRFEAEMIYHYNSVDKAGAAAGHGEMKSTAYMANVLYDLPTSSAWSPYVGAGLGAASLRLSTNSGAGNASGSDSEFAYQLMGGIGYSPDSLPNTQWTLGYRYLATSDPKFAGVTTEYSTHNVEAGAKFRF